MGKSKRWKILGDEGCTFAQGSHTAMGPYLLSKLNASGLSARKWTKLLMMMLQGRVEGSCLSHSMTMCSQIWTSALPQGQLVGRISVCILQWGHGQWSCGWSKCIESVTNFIQSYLHQIFDDSHGLKASLKPLRRPFDRCQSHLEAINNGRDIKQINW